MKSIRRAPKIKRMAKPGHYRPPMLNLPGKLNVPSRGRVGKMLPSLKKKR